MPWARLASRFRWNGCPRETWAWWAGGLRLGAEGEGGGCQSPREINDVVRTGRRWVNRIRSGKCVCAAVWCVEGRVCNDVRALARAAYGLGGSPPLRRVRKTAACTPAAVCGAIAWLWRRDFPFIAERARPIPRLWATFVSVSRWRGLHVLCLLVSVR